MSWSNVWSYTTIPSVSEILVVESVRTRAHLLRRDEQGNWPERALVIDDGLLELASIDFRVRRSISAHAGGAQAD